MGSKDTFNLTDGAVAERRRFRADGRDGQQVVREFLAFNEPNVQPPRFTLPRRVVHCTRDAVAALIARIQIGETFDSFLKEARDVSRPVEDVKIGAIYRLRRSAGPFGALNYEVCYDRGKFIDVRILSGPDRNNRYQVTCEDEQGNLVGPTGWRSYTLSVGPEMLEDVFEY